METEYKTQVVQNLAAVKARTEQTIERLKLEMSEIDLEIKTQQKFVNLLDQAILTYSNSKLTQSVTTAHISNPIIESFSGLDEVFNVDWEVGQKVYYLIRKFPNSTSNEIAEQLHKADPINYPTMKKSMGNVPNQISTLLRLKVIKAAGKRPRKYDVLA